MKPVKQYKIVIFVPETHADQMRSALGEAGAGVIGNYSHCTFSIKGITRFRPSDAANPSTGARGETVATAEERIETVCSHDKLEKVLNAIRANHPHEEPAPDVYPIEVFSN